MMEPDTIVGRIGDAVALDYSGDREGALARLAELWDEIHADGDALHRCMLAHYMADMQDHPHAELMWDQRALSAASSIAGEGARELYPSLHLNLAEDYRKAGDFSAAREHLARATRLAGELPENGYGNTIRRGIAGMAAQLAAEAG